MAKIITEESVMVVVGEERVEELSHRGYRLVRIVETDHVAEMQEKTVGDHGLVKCMAIKPAVLRQPRFVMRRSGVSVIAEQRESIEQLSGELALEHKREYAARERAEKLEEQLKILDSNHRTLRGELDAAKVGRTKAEESRRTLEADIGKIRQAIGDLRMQEILGAKGAGG